MGDALGGAGVSVEGGGAFTVGGRGIAHFLFDDGDVARDALERAGIRVVAVRDVVAQRLRQDVPGQLGALTRAMADAGCFDDGGGADRYCEACASFLARVEGAPV